MHSAHTVSLRTTLLTLLLLSLVGGTVAHASNDSFLGSLKHVKVLSSTVPSNGDVNPYGVAQVPTSVGKLVEGSFLISNFNNSNNLQGTGTTIVQISPNGSFNLFATIVPADVSCPGGVGLTTALVALRSGFVIVGSLPTTDGSAATAAAGCLIVLNSNGAVVEVFSGDHINGPWDMTAADEGTSAVLFVTNVLNGTVAAGGAIVNEGTVVRIRLGIFGDDPPRRLETTVIGKGFPERTDPSALVIGPTGVAFNWQNDVLYVADSLNNRIAAIPQALSRSLASNAGTTVSQNGALNDPLGLTLAPNGNLIAANGDDGNLVEINPQSGEQVATKLVDNSGSPPGSGALFGLIATDRGVFFVDDATNTFNLLH